MTIDEMWSGVRHKVTRAEVDAAHAQQDRMPVSALSLLAADKCIGRTASMNPSIYLLLRYHPINSGGPWVMFGLGSVVRVDG